MAHTGLTPQSSHVMGGFKTQGREEESWAEHEADAAAVAEAGAFALVLEGMVEPLAAPDHETGPDPDHRDRRERRMRRADPRARGHAGG